jgi:hypothetical protein
MATENTKEAIELLQKLQPNGPWVLIRILPDGSPIAITAHTAAEVDAFVQQHNGTYNLYYSLNPTKGPINKKPLKTDIAQVEYLLADLDPEDSETPEAAKARYLGQLTNSFEPEATALIDSGNGIQGLWKLVPPILLNGDATVVADIEARSKALMERLGAKAGTQNIDRILRLPGTTNLPNAKKRKAGRVPCPTKLLWFNGVSYGLEAFPVPKVERGPEPVDDGERKDDAHKDDAPKGDVPNEDWNKLERVIRDGPAAGEFETRSHAVWWVICEMFRRGYSPGRVVATLLDRKNKISDHIYDQSNPRKYAEKQVMEAKNKITFSTDDKGVLYKTQANSGLSR